MTLYFDIRVQNPETASINTQANWHQNFPLLAVAAYSQDKGGFVTIYDDQGEPLQDVESPGHSVAQVTALGWHPEKRWLVAGWETGEIRVWLGDSGNEFNEIVTPHKSAITILQWSQYGGRLISADTAGSIVGWKIDNHGQLLMSFHHELNDTFSQITFKIALAKPSIDLNDLAKAAVAGDERALDLFSTWRPRTAVQTAPHTQKDNHAFYIGSSSGTIYYIDILGQCVEVLNTGGSALHSLLHHQTRDSLVIMTEGLNIGHFQADPITGRLTELTRVKLSGKNDIPRSGPLLCWINNNTLAVLTGELGVRCWDLYTGDTYVLSPPDTLTGNMATPQEICTSLSFCKINETLAAGTNLGTIYLWKRKGTSHIDEYGWPVTPKSCTVHGTVKQIIWGGALLRNPLLAVNCITNVFILHQQSMCAAYNDGISVSQISPTQLFIEMDNQTHTLKTDIQIQILAVNKDFVAVSSSRQIAIYKINKNPLNTTVEQTFMCDTEKILIYETTLIILTPIVIQLRTIDGSLIQALPTLPEEGEPITMELTGQYLTVASLNGILKIWDISKREAKLHTRAMAAYEVINDFAEIIEARCNSDCRCVSITVAMSNLLPSSILYVWDIEGDQIFEFDFAKLHENDGEPLVKSRGRLVTAHCWDSLDSRVLICRAQKLQIRDIKGSITTDTDEANVVLVSLFATPDHGITVQDIRIMDDTNCRLLGVQSPYLIILSPEKENAGSSKVVKLLMREFEELGPCDDMTKKAIMDFSFYISMANMDEAFKSIKAIKNETVWKSLAKMCVKTKQLDMAVLCLGHMKHVKGARALREAIEDSTLNLEAKVGILAVQLGLYADAERLFRDAKRLDLLGNLLEGCNKYTEAIALAANENKIREKLSYYNYGKALEIEGNLDKAIDMYTKADCHHFQVPRMLLNRPRELQAYLTSTDDP